MVEIKGFFPGCQVLVLSGKGNCIVPGIEGDVKCTGNFFQARVMGANAFPGQLDVSRFNIFHGIRVHFICLKVNKKLDWKTGKLVSVDSLNPYHMSSKEGEK
jgi:hypothetical protein